MSNLKKSHKILVRNPSVPLRSNKKIEKTQSSKKVHFSDEPPPQPDPTFSAPEFCTLLQLAEEMKAVRHTLHSSRSLPEFAKQVKNVDFPPEEKLYQDLVDLDISERPLTEVRSQSCIRLKKDPEIDVNKYIKYNLEPEYFFTFNEMHLAKKQKPVFDGHAIYNKLAIWKGTV